MKLIVCTALCSFSLFGQVIVESGLLTGATATAAGAAGKGTAKSLVNVFGSVEKTMKSVPNPKPVPSVATATAEKPAEPVKLPDIAQIPVGMTREELLIKFGSPSQKMTIPEGSHLTERYRYDVDKDCVKVILEDGKVKEAIAIPPAPAVGPR